MAKSTRPGKAVSKNGRKKVAGPKKKVSSSHEKMALSMVLNNPVNTLRVVNETNKVCLLMLTVPPGNPAILAQQLPKGTTTFNKDQLKTFFSKNQVSGVVLSYQDPNVQSVCVDCTFPFNFDFNLSGIVQYKLNASSPGAINRTFPQT